MRTPNPWIAGPVLVATIAGGVIGFQVTRVSCAPGSCLGAAVAMALLGAALAFFGVGTVVVLAVRSMAEWRRTSAGPPPDDPPGPPTC